jgi:hypothetical protein
MNNSNRLVSPALKKVAPRKGHRNHFLEIPFASTKPAMKAAGMSKITNKDINSEISICDGC